MKYELAPTGKTFLIASLVPFVLLVLRGKKLLGIIVYTSGWILLYIVVFAVIIDEVPPSKTLPPHRYHTGFPDSGDVLSIGFVWAPIWIPLVAALLGGAYFFDGGWGKRPPKIKGERDWADDAGVLDDGDYDVEPDAPSSDQP